MAGGPSRSEACPRPDRAARFEAQRATLMRLAYRMTGSRAEAEDILQDAWLRWDRVDVDDVADDRAYLSRIVARLAMDAARRAATRRESYVGPWLPEPLPTADTPPSLAARPPGARLELAEDVSLALMTVLESLGPEERAAFLLREAFDLPYADIAAALGRSAAACRQMVARARTRVRARRPRFEASDEDHARLLEAFSRAAQAGDVTAMTALLTSDASLVTDGGGKVSAALRIVSGAQEVARLVAHVATRPQAPHGPAALVRINGRPALLMGPPRPCAPDAVPDTACLIDVEDGRIAAVYVIRNPDKLKGLRPGP